MILKHTL